MEHTPSPYEIRLACLYDEFSPAIYGFLLQYTLPNKAAELLLDVFVTAYRELPKAQEVRLAWLIRIACRHLRELSPNIIIELREKY